MTKTAPITLATAANHGASFGASFPARLTTRAAAVVTCAG
jgi:hypothetical protein